MRSIRLVTPGLPGILVQPTAHWMRHAVHLYGDDGNLIGERIGWVEWSEARTASARTNGPQCRADAGANRVGMPPGAQTPCVDGPLVGCPGHLRAPLEVPAPVSPEPGRGQPAAARARYRPRRRASGRVGGGTSEAVPRPSSS